MYKKIRDLREDKDLTQQELVSIDYLLGQTDNPKPYDKKRHE